MSRHAQLPPRCPLQKKNVANFSMLPPSSKDIELHGTNYGHYKSISQSSVLEEQLPWLDDLLSDSDSNPNGTLHRRAASDSSTLSDGLGALADLDQLNEKETDDSCEPDDGLESTCTYGPNSPRRKTKLGFPENEIVSAFAEYVMQSPLQHLDGYSSVSGVLQSDSFGDANASTDQINSENKLVKRHPGQRSRARKLQYIAELERTVDVLQNVGSELGVRVASLIQQYAALSMENNTLKQQLLRMKHEKFILDGDYQSLKREVERLRSGLAKVQPRSRPNFACSDPVWNMLDMRKLDLN